MNLFRFRVTNFRSVEDSGWIDTDSITALIGTNESGKTNLLLPLWKLNPAKDGEINSLLDYPRKRYNEIRVSDTKPIFIEADFQLDEHLSEDVSHMTGFPKEQLCVTRVARNYSGEHLVTFPEASVPGKITSQQLLTLIKSASDSIISLEPLKSEDDLKQEILSTLASAQSDLSSISQEILQLSMLRDILNSLEAVKISDSPKRSIIVPRFGSLIDELKDILKRIDKPHPNEVEEAKNIVLNHLPKFVYYSNYGNLDSEIYLPHVIENLQRTDLGPKEEAKTRTLRVLFDFVRLEPEEILELGKDIPIQNAHPTEQQIEEIANKKKERTILLQSASTELTTKFRDWWRQGNYIFQFQADGDHFRIWVSDQIRPEPIELESRSSGLQWFLSFYLIFLVESQENHADSILLLDEPGLSLHPLAQEDLSLFFENLSRTNQLIYTTHSPFMVDSNHLDRVRAVYVEENGETKVSPDLRAREKQPSQSRSIYPVHAALGLSVTDTLFLGCQIVIVEGQSDQFYLSAIKNYLVGNGLIKPQKEIVFVPAGGVRGINAVTPIISGHDEQLPFVILDSDKVGTEMVQKLRSNLYKDFPNLVISIGELIPLSEGEIEDLFPVDFISNIISRKYREPEESFDDVVKTTNPILNQFEAYAQKYKLTLSLGWKVELAKMAKNRLNSMLGTISVDSEYVIIWKKLFDKILA
jgi:predicted ATP-dependent endonuclease of OLD family